MSIFPNMRDGRKVVAAAGTPERLVAANTTARKVTIMAEIDNSDYVVVGGSTVVASLSTRRGIPLTAGMSITLDINDLYEVWLDAVVSGEGVSYIYQF
jgi:radical SAM superfamily enzyme YgiQ (UPF0313 family)